MAYRELASLYDQIMTHAPYTRWLSFTEEIFKQSGKNINSIADLGCGTGEMTIRLAEMGYKLFGIDHSVEMLTYADQKARNKNLSVQWLHQDLRSFYGITNLDVAISYCDVMNYITSKQDLRTVFKRVAQSLNSGGLFIFDIHSLYHAQSNLINQTFADVSDDFSYVWFCYSGDSVGELYHDLTFFVREDDRYIRFDESHHQQTYPVETYVQLLTESGFENIKMYSDFSPKMKKLHEKAERIFFVTQKRSG